MTLADCILTYQICSQIAADGIGGLLLRGILCVAVSNGIFLLCYGGRKEFRQLFAIRV